MIQLQRLFSLSHLIATVGMAVMSVKCMPDLTFIEKKKAKSLIQSKREQEKCVVSLCVSVVV